MLLQRRRMPALEAVEYLVGLQGQEQLPPYMALWARLEDFDPRELSVHLEDRSAVRGTLMRGTVHLVSARDYLLLRPLVQPTIDRWLKSSAWGRNLRDADLDAIGRAGRELLAEKPMTWKVLGEALKQRWPELDAQSMAYSMQATAPLVHVPPRGLWKGVGQTTLTTVEAWLGVATQEAPAIDDVVLRYLRVFGPASVMDMQSWATLTRLGPVFERLRPRLRTYRGEDGKELFDVEDGVIADPDLPAPVRFMPVYDNLMLAHADRGRIVSRELHQRMITANGFFATFMVDGFVRGRWEIAREKKERVILQVLPFQQALSKTEAAEVEAEGLRMLDFLEEPAGVREVRFLEPEE